MRVASKILLFILLPLFCSPQVNAREESAVDELAKNFVFNALSDIYTYGFNDYKREFGSYYQYFEDSAHVDFITSELAKIKSSGLEERQDIQHVHILAQPLLLKTERKRIPKFLAGEDISKEKITRYYRVPAKRMHTRPPESIYENIEYLVYVEDEQTEKNNQSLLITRIIEKDFADDISGKTCEEKLASLNSAEDKLNNTENKYEVSFDFDVSTVPLNKNALFNRTALLVYKIFLDAEGVLAYKNFLSDQALVDVKLLIDSNIKNASMVAISPFVITEDGGNGNMALTALVNEKPSSFLVTFDYSIDDQKNITIEKIHAPSEPIRRGGTIGCEDKLQSMMLKFMGNIDAFNTLKSALPK